METVEPLSVYNWLIKGLEGNIELLRRGILGGAPPGEETAANLERLAEQLLELAAQAKEKTP